MKKFKILGFVKQRPDTSWMDFVKLREDIISFLDTLKPMRGSGRAPYRWDGFGQILIIERDSDAVAFRLRFGI